MSSSELESELKSKLELDLELESPESDGDFRPCSEKGAPFADQFLADLDHLIMC